MLVLERKTDQRILITDGEDRIELVVVEGECRLGIDAPDHFDILREELLPRLER